MDYGAIIAAIINVIGGFASSMFNADMQMNIADEANENARQNQREQNNWSEYMSMIQKTWESPKNQMELYREAGINPALAAQGISGISGQGTMASGSSGAQTFMPDLSNIFAPLQQFMDAGSKVFEMRKVNKETNWIDRLNDAQQKKILQDIKTSKSTEKLNEQQKESLKIASEQLVRMNDENVEKIRQETNNLISFNEQIEAITNKTNKESDVLDKDIELKDKQIENISADIKLKEQQTDQSKSQTDLNYQNIAESASRIGLNETAKLLTQSQIDLNNVETLNKLYEAIKNDYRTNCLKYGFNPEDGWINNIMGVSVKAYEEVKAGIKAQYNEFNNAVNNMFDKIGEGFSEMNRGMKNHKSTNNIYGTPWNSGTIWNP